MDRTTTPTDPLAETGRFASARIVLFHLELEQACVEFGLPKPYSESTALLFLLHAMGKARNPLSITGASAMLRQPGATTTRKLHELCTSKLILLERDTADRRRVFPTLTPLGQDAIQSFHSILGKMALHMVDQISIDGESLREMRLLMGHPLRRLT